MKRIITYEITQKDSGKSIYTFLREHFYSYKILTFFRHQEGSILVNNTPALMKSLISSGDMLTVVYSEDDESENIIPSNLPFEIVYEDEDIMVINKPADMPVHPAINNFDNTLANALTYYFNQKNEKLVFRCINRLDRNTSGLLIVAKHRLAGSILADFMKKREIHREYIALASGNLCKPYQSNTCISKQNDDGSFSGTINAPIGRVNESIIERFVDFENGVSAITHFKTLKYFEDVTPYIKHTSEFLPSKSLSQNPATLISLKLDTGRTHQIRVHMAYIGHPLLGDSLYNKEPGPLNRQALHSYCIEFVHPITLERMIFKSDSIPFLNEF